MKAPHHRGDFDRRSRAVKAAAYASTDTRCWFCGRTLAEIRRYKPTARWTAGHVVDGQVNGELRAECSPCNYGRGAAMGNAQRKRTEFTW